MSKSATWRAKIVIKFFVKSDHYVKTNWVLPTREGLIKFFHTKKMFCKGFCLTPVAKRKIVKNIKSKLNVGKLKHNAQKKWLTRPVNSHTCLKMEVVALIFPFILLQSLAIYCSFRKRENCATLYLEIKCIISARDFSTLLNSLAPSFKVKTLFITSDNTHAHIESIAVVT